MARTGLAGAARVARWADAALGRGSATTDGKATLSDATAERAAADLGLSAAQIRADWDTARLAGLVEVHGDSARPGWRLRAWDRDDSAVLRGWVALFDAWSLACPEPDGHEPAAVAEVVSAMPQLLSFLQLSAGPVPVDQLLDLLQQRVTELRTERCEVSYEHGTGEPARPPAPAAPAADAPLAPLLDWALRALASVGALTYGGGQATLTPLGSWAVWVKLEQICVAAQSPAGNIEQSAEDMLRGCAQLRPNAARAEYRAWLAARPVGSAVTQLVDAARGDDALLRGLAFEALRVVGAPAEPDVRAVVDEPALRPYALLWLAEHDGIDPEDAHEVLTREEATWLWVDTAAAVADHGEAPMLVRHLESAVQPTVPRLLDEVRAVGHPRTVQVLVALAAAHPDPALAKAVRRAAFQVHTGG
jgi:phosphoribosyl-ATP pyrophosphohydrolase